MVSHHITPKLSRSTMTAAKKKGQHRGVRWLKDARIFMSVSKGSDYTTKRSWDEYGRRRTIHIDMTGPKVVRRHWDSKGRPVAEPRLERYFM